jgi:hypothetical protein
MNLLQNRYSQRHFKMANPQLTIPEEFRSDLHYVDALDKRSDEEILDSLTKHAPVTSEKNVWTYWHAGVRSMPAWCQRNIVSWIRLCGPSWSIRVLDNVPDSPNNAFAWVEADQLPETFVKGTMDGPYGSFVHFFLLVPAPVSNSVLPIISRGLNTDFEF